jgi:hypothetical protein
MLIYKKYQAGSKTSTYQDSLTVHDLSMAAAAKVRTHPHYINHLNTTKNLQATIQELFPAGLTPQKVENITSKDGTTTYTVPIYQRPVAPPPKTVLTKTLIGTYTGDNPVLEAYNAAGHKTDTLHHYRDSSGKHNLEPAGKQDYWTTDPTVLKFREFFRNVYGEEPSRDPNIAKYDYDAAYKAGVRPVLDERDGLYHWDSKYKHDDHPNRYVNGQDTKAEINDKQGGSVAPLRHMKKTYPGGMEFYFELKDDDKTWQQIRPDRYQQLERANSKTENMILYRRGGKLATDCGCNAGADGIDTDVLKGQNVSKLEQAVGLKPTGAYSDELKNRLKQAAAHTKTRLVDLIKSVDPAIKVQ